MFEKNSNILFGSPALFLSQFPELHRTVFPPKSSFSLLYAYNCSLATDNRLSLVTVPDLLRPTRWSAFVVGRSSILLQGNALCALQTTQSVCPGPPSSAVVFFPAPQVSSPSVLNRRNPGKRECGISSWWRPSSRITWSFWRGFFWQSLGDEVVELRSSGGWCERVLVRATSVDRICRGRRFTLRGPWSDSQRIRS